MGPGVCQEITKIIHIYAFRLESLVVGCPLCDRERGRVYVYANTGSMTTPVSSFIRSGGGGGGGGGGGRE